MRTPVILFLWSALEDRRTYAQGTTTMGHRHPLLESFVPLNIRILLMASMLHSAAISSSYGHTPVRPVWFGSRLFVHSERTITRAAR